MGPAGSTGARGIPNMLRRGIASLLTLAVLGTVGCAHSDTPLSAREGGLWKSASKDRRMLDAKEAEPPKILPETYFAAGHLLEQQGRIERAIVQYRRAVAVGHKYAPAYHRLGLLLSETGRRADALQALRRATELAPRDAIVRNNLGYELMMHEKWEDAAHEFSRAVELESGFARAHVNYGMALSKLGRFDEALASFRAVLPEADAYYNLGLMYRGQQRYEEATEAFTRVLTFDPSFTAAIVQLEQLAPRVDRLAWNLPAPSTSDSESGAWTLESGSESAGAGEGMAAIAPTEHDPGSVFAMAGATTSVTRSDLSPFLLPEAEWYSPLRAPEDDHLTLQLSSEAEWTDWIDAVAILRNNMDCKASQNDDEYGFSPAWSSSDQGTSPSSLSAWDEWLREGADPNETQPSSRKTLGMTILESDDSSSSSESHSPDGSTDEDQPSEPDSDRSSGRSSYRITPRFGGSANEESSAEIDSEFLFAQYLGETPDKNAAGNEQHP